MASEAAERTPFVGVPEFLGPQFVGDVPEYFRDIESGAVSSQLQAAGRAATRAQAAGRQLPASKQARANKPETPRLRIQPWT